MTKTALFTELTGKILNYNQNFDLEFLNRAYNFAKKAHKGQRRESWEEYIIHPLHTAINLARIEADEISIAAGLLHDVPEDTSFSIKDLEKEFWKELAKVVDWVTKMSKLQYKENAEDCKVDSFRKFFISAWKDFRTILVKVADRLHNLETLHYLPEEKRVGIAKESLEIYSPIISLLSIWEFVSEFDDICFKYINPIEYKKMHNIFGKKRKFYKEKIENAKKQASYEISKSLWFKVKITWRIKSLYSIFKKMKGKHLSHENIHDVIALRIIVKKKKDCYLVLWVLHSIFKIKNDKFKDYISSPKNNWYQSIHTTIFGSSWEIIEFQIQTEEMRYFNKFWLASHYIYKNAESNFWKTPRWIKNILKIQKNTKDSQSFFESFKREIPSAYIVCFTVTWEQITLPVNSTLLDFAYEINKNYWNRFKSAYINNKYTENPIMKVREWDIISLTKSNANNTEFSVNLINDVKTNRAKNSLHALFRNQSEKKKKKLWYVVLTTELDSLWIRHINSISLTIIKEFLSQLNCKTKSDLYKKLWAWDIDINYVVSVLMIIDPNKNYAKKVNLKIFLKVIDIKSISKISKLLSELKITIASLLFKGDYLKISFNVKDFKELKTVISELNRAPNVRSIKRVFPLKILFIYILLALTFICILLNSIVFQYFVEKWLILENINILETYSAIPIFWTMFLAIYLFKKVSEITLTDRDSRKNFWLSIIFLTTLAIWEVFWQSFYLGRLWFNSIIFLWFTLIIYSLLVFDYISLKIDE